jgi:hypothetical protein
MRTVEEILQYIDLMHLNEQRAQISSETIEKAVTHVDLKKVGFTHND